MGSLPSSDSVHLLTWEGARADALIVRLAVFVIEQGVPFEEEEDDLDPIAMHALVYEGQTTPIATGRLTPDGRIGRIAVVGARRRKGLGKKVLHALVDHARTCGLRQVNLHAQVQAKEFYRRFGFLPEGEVFEEAGIAHVRMCCHL